MYELEQRYRAVCTAFGPYTDLIDRVTIGEGMGSFSQLLKGAIFALSVAEALKSAYPEFTISEIANRYWDDAGDYTLSIDYYDPYCGQYTVDIRTNLEDKGVRIKYTYAAPTDKYVKDYDYVTGVYKQRMLRDIPLICLPKEEYTPFNAIDLRRSPILAHLRSLKDANSRPATDR